MELGNLVQTPDETVCISLSPYALGKGMNPSLPSTLKLWVNSRVDWALDTCMATGLGEGKL